MACHAGVGSIVDYGMIPTPETMTPQRGIEADATSQIIIVKIQKVMAKIS